MKNKFFLRDAIIFLCALVLSLGALFCLLFLKKEGAYAVVLVGGEEHSRYPLSRDTVSEIATEYGQNTLQIEKGKAKIIFADCPDGVCTAHSPASNGGETIVCLPNKLVVEIRGE